MTSLLLVKLISKATFLPIAASGGFSAGQASVRSPSAQSDGLGGTGSSAKVRHLFAMAHYRRSGDVATSAVQSVALINSRPNAADRIATTLAEAQAALLG